MKKAFFGLMALAGLTVSTLKAAGEDGWVSMFNGKDLAGWKSNEELPGCFTVENGELKVSGCCAHLFYIGLDGCCGSRTSSSRPR